VSPDGQPGDGRPELRASHADRDRVVEELRVAAGDGRLTAEELDERLEAALTARTYRELAVLTADLPPAGVTSVVSATPKDVLRMVHKGGNAHQAGRWVVPKRIEAKVTGGNVKLDFTEAVITDRVLQVDADVRGGNLVIVTKPGVVVDTNDITTVGGNVHNRPIWPEAPIALTVEITGQVKGGNVRVRGPRRTFWQWLMRRPLPGPPRLPASPARHR
jgi:hypothetical protein